MVLELRLPTWEFSLTKCGVILLQERRIAYGEMKRLQNLDSICNKTTHSMEKYFQTIQGINLVAEGIPNQRAACHQLSPAVEPWR